MAQVVFLRGINVGGHRRFRSTLLAEKLTDFDTVNVGTAGTLVVRKPIAQARLRAALLRELPFKTQIMFCNGRDLLRLAAENPFKDVPMLPGLTRFVSIWAADARLRPKIPFALPSEREWLLRVLAARDQFVFGIYRRHMKTIGYLGRLDKIFGASAATRNWNTIAKVAKILKYDT